MSNNSINSHKTNYGGTESASANVSSNDECSKCSKCRNRDRELSDDQQEINMEQNSQNDMSARIFATATSSMGESNYDALCSCPEDHQRSCQCTSKQAWKNWKWRPQNYPHWATVRKILIICAIVGLFIWLLMYLFLHFYLERPSQDQEKEN